MNVRKLLYTIAPLLMGGCVPVLCLHPLYTKENIVIEKKLLGTWVDDVNNPETIWEFKQIDEPGDAGLAILSGHQRAMLEHAADLKDNARGIEEERRPARVGGAGDKDVARQDRFLVRLVEHLDLTPDHAR